MKLVSVLLRPEQLAAVKQSLFDAQINHFTASTVLGTAPKSEQQMYRGVEKHISLFNRVRVEIACSNSYLEQVIDAICLGAKESGGHGKIFVTEITDVVKIWTGERGERAL